MATAKETKFYAVCGGRDGPFVVYRDWTQTLAATTGKKACKFKSFPTRDEAVAWGAPLEPHFIEPAAPRAVVDDVTVAWSDGGCEALGTPQAVAGCGVYFAKDDERNVSVRLPGPLQTNNRAELFAALVAVLSMPPDADRVVYTDSMYTIRAVTQWCPRWLTDASVPPRERTNNWDLIHVLYTALQDRPRVQLKHVKGHNGTHGNEEADRLATQAMKKRKTN